MGDPALVDPSQASPPLAGLRVVEVGEGAAGAYCGRLLTDLGAEVAKVEPPGGDPSRHRGPFPPGRADADRGGPFHHLNRGKRSVVADLASAAGIGLVRALAAGADVVVESLGPGALERLGLGPAALAAARGELVVVRISNFGQEGPRRDHVATDLTLQAAGGWMYNRSPEGRPPVRVGGEVLELVAGAYAAAAVPPAVHAARRGRGHVVCDVSVAEAAMATLPQPTLMQETLARYGRSATGRRFGLPGIVRCRDGWVGINSLTGQHFEDICALTGTGEWAGRLQELMYPGEATDAYYRQLQEWLDHHDVDEIVELAQLVRVPAAPLGTGETLPSLAQFEARGFYRHDAWLGAPLPSPPMRLSATPTAPPQASSPLGSDTGWAARGAWA